MSLFSSPLRRRATLGVLTLALFAACSDLQGPAADPTPVALPFRVGFAPQLNVATVVVTVTGVRIDPALVFNFPVVNDTAQGTMVLPTGTNRLIVAQGFDSTGTEVLRGQRTVNINAGTNTGVVLVMSPLTGSLPVTAVLGNVTLSLTSAAPSVRSGGTVALTAEVRDETNAVVSVPVLFAVSRPPAAQIRADGLLTALDTGSVTVTATALGRSASIVLTLTAGTALEGLELLPDSVIGSGPVEALVMLRDNVGVDSVRVRTLTPSGATGPTCAALAPLRGTRTFGDFTCTLVIPVGGAAGDWPVSQVEVHAGLNVAILDSIALRHRGASVAVRNVP
jgi:Bacterial Ig-like domain (group 2)